MRILRKRWITRTTLVVLGIFLGLSSGWSAAEAAEETASGRLVAKFVDHDPALGRPAELHYTLVDETGAAVQVALDAPGLLVPYGGVRVLLGELITVSGEREGKLLKVSEISSTLDPAKKHPQPISGSMPQVTLLLRYANDSSTPRTKSYFEYMYTSSSFPGTNHYIKEASYNIANLDGSRVFGWYDLPGNWDYYNWDKDGNGYAEFDLDRALPDAVNEVDADVNFPDYVTVNFVMNGHIACNDSGATANDVSTSCAWSMTEVYISADVTIPAPYGFTIMGFWGHDRMAVVPHETQHTWGLHHSGGYAGYPYDSNWDVMSGQGLNWDPTYGHLTVYGISWHMLGMGWIPPARNWNTGEIRAGIIQVERLEFPSLVPGTYGMAQVLIHGYTNYFYTVEYRTLEGWDASGGIPGQAVLLHKVDITLGDQQAKVVDPDLDGDPNDQSAIWRPTETYLDQSNQVIIHVEDWTPTTARVSLSNRALINVYVDDTAPEPGYGTPADPWNTVEEGYASVFQGGTVYLTPGTYAESFRLGKACRLVREGSSGVVRIGN